MELFYNAGRKSLILMGEGMAEREILDSWKEISDYLKRDARTCQRYEVEIGLPVHRLDGSSKARVFAYKDELDAWRGKKPPEPAAGLGRVLGFIKPRPFIAAASAILILGLGALIYRVSSGLLDGRERRPRISIAVLPFQSASGQTDLNKWTTGIPQLLIQGLSGSGYFSILSNDRTNDVLRELGIKPGDAYTASDLKRIGARSGATHAVLGHILKAGDGLVLTLTTREIGADEAHSSRFECDGDAAVIPASSRMADQVKKDLGLTRTPQTGDFDAPQVPITTSSLEAFRLYNEGRRFHVRAEYSESARIMRKALVHDPEFALAWRSLAASLGSRGAGAEAVECLRKALAFSRNASMQEQLFIRTAYFHHRSEFGRALQTSREWLSLYPDDTQAMLFTGRALLFEEDAEGARSVLDGGLKKGDRNPFMFFYAALANTAAGLFDEAARVRERGLSIHADNRLIATAGVIDAIVQGRHDRAQGELDEIRAEKPEVSFDLKLGDVLLLRGDFRAAERCYTNARSCSDHAVAKLARLALAEGRYGRAAELAAAAKDHALLAHIESRRGRLPEGFEAALKALKTGEEGGDCLMELVALYLKGALEVQAGRLEAAKASAAQIREGGGRGLKRAHERAARCLDGLIASAEGRHEQAEKEFEAAVRLLPRDMPYLDDQPYQIGVVACMHAMVLYAAGREYERAGNMAIAPGYYQRLIGLNGGRLQHPDLYALSHYALGRIKQDQGDAHGAKESLAKFLELWKDADPGLPEVQEAKKRLAALDQR
jgi:tetratricopeptide (TPR) repeat protein/TolB-like protein